MTFTVYWQTTVAPGLTFYSGALTVRAHDKTDAADFARRKVARDFPDRPGHIQITAVDSLSEQPQCPR